MLVKIAYTNDRKRDESRHLREDILEAAEVVVKLYTGFSHQPSFICRVDDRTGFQTHEWPDVGFYAMLDITRPGGMVALIAVTDCVIYLMNNEGTTFQKYTVLNIPLEKAPVEDTIADLTLLGGTDYAWLGKDAAGGDALQIVKAVWGTEAEYTGGHHTEAHIETTKGKILKAYRKDLFEALAQGISPKEMRKLFTPVQQEASCL